MFNKITPEQAGIKSNDVLNYIKMLNDRHLSMHAILMMKGDDIFAETYYFPFNANYTHRLYSETKSFVSIAIGLLIDEGKISLNDTLASYFPDKISETTDKWLLNQTIKDTLEMRTSVRCENWFKAKEDDRVKLYFKQKAIRPSGLIFEYDSAGSMVLSALVERVTNMSLFDYLNKKIFSKLNTFKTAYMLKTPCGYSWGDSGLMATLRDVASIGRLLLNNGSYNNEQLISKEYINLATSKQVDNHESGYFGYRSNGYGYQIWRIEQDGYAFFGMGNELTFMFPKKNILFACFANDQGNTSYRELIANGVYEIIKNANDTPIEENPSDYNKLVNYLANQELISLKTNVEYDLVNKINNVTYKCDDSFPIKEFKLNFNKDNGLFTYIKDNQEKQIPFGINKNEFFKFNELGYSNLVGKEKTADYQYNSCASIAFTNKDRVKIDVRIIDKYLGSLFIMISFKDDYALIKLVKYAENFLDDYQGETIAKIK